MVSKSGWRRLTFIRYVIPTLSACPPIFVAGGPRPRRDESKGRSVRPMAGRDPGPLQRTEARPSELGRLVTLRRDGNLLRETHLPPDADPSRRVDDRRVVDSRNRGTQRLLRDDRGNACNPVFVSRFDPQIANPDIPPSHGRRRVSACNFPFSELIQLVVRKWAVSTVEPSWPKVSLFSPGRHAGPHVYFNGRT